MQSSRVRGISCLLDTDVVIDFLRRRAYARQLLEEWVVQGLLAISSFTQLEVHQGMRPDEQEATNAFLDGLVSIPMDVPVARRAGRILRGLRIKGVTTSVGDAVIAATALEVGVPLLTNNVEHYPFAGLKLVRGLGA